MSFFSLLSAQYTNLPIPLTQEACAGHTYIVTGANTGLGYECAKHLASLHCARIIMAVRNPQSGEAAKSAIEAETGRTGVLRVWRLDMASFESVKAFVKRVESELDRVDGIVENAGVAMGEWTEAEGMETTVTVNVVATLLLAVLMVPVLEGMASKFGTTPRIAVVSSMVAWQAQAELAKMDRNNVLADLRDGNKWKPYMAESYPRSKMLLQFAGVQLAAAAPVSKTGVIINFGNPGICNTGLSKNSTLAMRMQIGLARTLMGRTAEMGSRTLLHGLAAGRESHGAYLSECEVKEDHVPEWFTNEDGQLWQQRIWEEVSQKLEQIQPGCVRNL